MRCNIKINIKDVRPTGLLCFALMPVLLFQIVACSSGRSIRLAQIKSVREADRFLNRSSSEEILEEIIYVYQDTLKSVSVEDESQYYAELKNKEGLSYNYLADKKNKEENLIKAVTAFEQALLYRTIDEYPFYYAETQNNLGTTYINLSTIRYKEENVTKAILVFEEALRVYSIDTYPFNYAMLHNNLGTANGTLS